VLDHVRPLAWADHAEATGLALERLRVAQGGAARTQARVLALERGQLGAALPCLVPSAEVGARRPDVEADHSHEDDEQRDAPDPVPADPRRPGSSFAADRPGPRAGPRPAGAAARGPRARVGAA
jgi:hypothetical protein